MRSWSIPFLVVCLAGCGGQSTIRPAEILDEKTGITVGALQEPVEFVEAESNSMLGSGKRTSFAYLGPVEWDRSGELTYALWVHVAPGNDRQVGDIRSSGAVSLVLADGPIALSPMAPPDAGTGPYRPVASWGQTSYFALDIPTLKRIAASPSVVLAFRGADRSVVEFMPTHETGPTFRKFTHARGITDD